MCVFYTTKLLFRNINIFWFINSVEDYIHTVKNKNLIDKTQ